MKLHPFGFFFLADNKLEDVRAMLSSCIEVYEDILINTGEEDLVMVSRFLDFLQDLQEVFPDGK